MGGSRNPARDEDVMRIHVRMTLYINTGNSFFIVWSLWIRLQSWPSALISRCPDSSLKLPSGWSWLLTLLFPSHFLCPLHILCSTLERAFESQLPRCQRVPWPLLNRFAVLLGWFRDHFAIQTRLKCPGRWRGWLSVQDCQLPGALGTHLVRMFLFWLRRICQSFWNHLSLHQMCYSMGKFTFEKPLRKNTDDPKALLPPLTSHFFLLSLVSFSGSLILCMCSWGNLPSAKIFNDLEFLMLTLNQFLQMLMISLLIFSQCCSLQTGQVFSLVLRKCLSDLQVKLLKNDT